MLLHPDNSSLSVLLEPWGGVGGVVSDRECGRGMAGDRGRQGRGRGQRDGQTSGIRGHIEVLVESVSSGKLQ